MSIWCNTVAILSITVFKLYLFTSSNHNNVPIDKFCKSPSIKATLGLLPSFFFTPNLAMSVAKLVETNDFPVPGLIEDTSNTFLYPYFSTSPASSTSSSNSTISLH